MIIYYIVEKNIFCCYCLQAFSKEEILKVHIKDVKIRIKMAKNGEYVKFKNFERTLKSLFIIYADFENNLVPEDSGIRNPRRSYTNQYKKHVVSSYGYKLVLLMITLVKIYQFYDRNILLICLHCD